MFRKSILSMMLVVFTVPMLQAQTSYDAESAAAKAALIAVRTEISATLQLSKLKVRQLQRLINGVNDLDAKVLLQAQLGNISLSMQFNQTQLDNNKTNFLDPGTSNDDAAQVQQFADNHVLAEDLFKKAKKFFVDGKSDANTILAGVNEDLASLNELMLQFWY